MSCVPKFNRTEDANTPVRLLDLDLDMFLKALSESKRTAVSRAHSSRRHC